MTDTTTTEPASALPYPWNLPEPADRETVVIDDGSDRWKMWWRHDAEAEALGLHCVPKDGRWFEDHDEDPMSWEYITSRAMAVYAVTKIAEAPR